MTSRLLPALALFLVVCCCYVTSKVTPAPVPSSKIPIMGAVLWPKIKIYAFAAAENQDTLCRRCLEEWGARTNRQLSPSPCIATVLCINSFRCHSKPARFWRNTKCGVAIAFRPQSCLFFTVANRCRRQRYVIFTLALPVTIVACS